MDRKNLLKSIAETGYNVGFGAKKNFATHDIVQKAPGYVAFVSLAVGVYALVFEPLTSKWVGASVVVLGLVGLYVTYYDDKKEEYAKEGERLTKLFYMLRDLYRDVQSLPDDSELRSFQARLTKIQDDALQTNQSKQIAFSDWYAHYKFFWQHQIDWIDEQKQFSTFRDRIPLSLTIFVIIALIAGTAGLVILGWRGKL